MESKERALIFLEAARQALYTCGNCKKSALEEVEKIIEDLKGGRIEPSKAEDMVSAIEELSYDIPELRKERLH